MGQGNEPAANVGAFDVPPELQEAFDKAVAATQRFTTTSEALARDAFVAEWEAITRHEAFGSAPPAFRAHVFNMLGMAFHLRATGGAGADIDAAIAAFEAAVATVPADSASRSAYLGSLGFAIVDRLSENETIVDRDAAIAAFAEALKGTPVDSPNRPRYLTNLGIGLHHRFDSGGVPADLDAAITAFEEALEVTPVDSPKRPGYLTNLGAGLKGRFDAREAPADLDAAIAAYRGAADATPADDPNRSARLSKLGLGLRERYDRGRASTDLDAAIATFEEAVETSPADAPNRPDRLDNLGNALLERYDQSGAPADLEAAILAFEMAVETSPADDPGRPGRLTNLGNSLQSRMARTGSPADLEAAITAFEEAVDTGPSGGPDRALYLTNLGSGLLDRHVRSGAQADLDAAIAAFEEAVEIGRDDAPGQLVRINNLGGGLAARYDRTGSIADLEAMMAGYEEALAATPVGDPGRPARLNNVGMCLRERYIRRGATTDLDAAIAFFQEALEATPTESPERPKILANVGVSLSDRYDATGNVADLEASIAACRQALDATPADATARPVYLEMFGNGLRARFRGTREPADLEASIAALRESIEATPADSPYRESRLANLAYGLAERHGRTNAETDLEAAIDAIRKSCRLGLTPAITLGTAQQWGGWASARGAWAEAAEAYGHGLAAIDRLYQSQLLPGAKQTWLGAAQGLAASAAYALARIGAPAAAFLALERGRARVLTEAIQRDRADLADVEALDPGAYAAYEQAAGNLRALESQERAGGTGRPEAASVSVSAGALQDQARQARAGLEAAISRLQRLPGHARFGQPPTIDEVARVAEPGRPLVALVTTSAGSVALLVSRGEDSAAPTFEAIWAPGLTTTVLNDLLTTVEDGQVVGGYLAGQLREPEWLEAALADGLPKVGASLIGPIAARLRELSASGVVLLPTGLLGLLPLHAAPYPVDGEEHCLLDEFDVSHTPGALVLRAARAALAAREEAPPVLVGVGNPLPHPQPLAFARAELEEVARFFPEGARHPLYETAATETALVGLLPQATHVHLACHGRFDADTPLDSCLELARPDPPPPDGDEGRLRLEEILANDWFGHSRLVVLSACQTAITDARRLPDEAIGLPAGLLQAGVPGVIGTLWSVDDLSTTLLMTQFYAYHRQGDPQTGDGPLPPAAALRRAQGWLRTRTADDLVTLLAAHRSMAAADEQRRSTRMSAAEAGAGVRQLGLEEPTSRPFADPYYWAPFVAIGV
jgi:CHAT domain-containing protein